MCITVAQLRATDCVEDAHGIAVVISCDMFLNLEMHCGVLYGNYDIHVVIVSEI